MKPVHSLSNDLTQEQLVSSWVLTSHMGWPVDQAGRYAGFDYSP